MIEVFDDISRETIFSFYENFNNFQETVGTDVKDLYHPWKRSKSKTCKVLNFSAIIQK